MVEIVDLHQFGLFVESRSFQLLSRSLQSTALLTGEPSTAGPTVQRWVARLTSGAQGQLEWRLFDGLIASLKGTTGLTRCFDPGRRQTYFDLIAAKTSTTWDDGTTWDDNTGWQDGCLPHAVAVDEAAKRNARSVVMKSFPVSTAGVLRWGDLFEIRPSGVPAPHAHLYIVKRVANSDATGRSRVEFEPGLRTGVAPGDMVVLRDASTVFRLASDGEGEMNVNAPNIGRFGLALTEVLPEA